MLHLLRVECHLNTWCHSFCRSFLTDPFHLQVLMNLLWRQNVPQLWCVCNLVLPRTRLDQNCRNWQTEMIFSRIQHPLIRVQPKTKWQYLFYTHLSLLKHSINNISTHLTLFQDKLQIFYKKGNITYFPELWEQTCPMLWLWCSNNPPFPHHGRPVWTRAVCVTAATTKKIKTEIIPRLQPAINHRKENKLK